MESGLWISREAELVLKGKQRLISIIILDILKIIFTIVLATRRAFSSVCYHFSFRAELLYKPTIYILGGRK